MVVYWRSKEALQASVGEESVVLRAADFQYFDFNPVASEIWTLLEPPGLTVAELVSTLTSEFLVQAEDCERDVRAFLAKGVEEGLIECGPQ